MTPPPQTLTCSPRYWWPARWYSSGDHCDRDIAWEVNCWGSTPSLWWFGKEIEVTARRLKSVQFCSYYHKLACHCTVKLNTNTKIWIICNLCSGTEYCLKWRNSLLVKVAPRSTTYLSFWVRNFQNWSDHPYNSLGDRHKMFKDLIPIRWNADIMYDSSHMYINWNFLA